MAWHLKDRELEKKIIAIDPNFLSSLKTFAEFYDLKAQREPIEIYFGRYVNCSRQFCLRVLFDDLENVPDYSPNRWNRYPAVTPPEDVPMRIVVEGPFLSSRHCAIFKEGKWRKECDGKPSSMIECIDGVKLFRPWDGAKRTG